MEGVQTEHPSHAANQLARFANWLLFVRDRCALFPALSSLVSQAILAQFRHLGAGDNHPAQGAAACVKIPVTMRRFLPSLLIILSACKPPRYQPPPTPAPIVTATPSVTPTPLPTPTPTPTIPRKTLDVSQLFNGITLFSKFETPQSEKPASVERNADDSYKIQITFTANLPNPSRTLEELADNDPTLAEVLSQLTRLVDTARVSPYFAKLYENKIEHLRERLNRLDLLFSRHNFYDCETILELQHPDTGRKALLMQGDMDT
jgi:hypothetical protein